MNPLLLKRIAALLVSACIALSCFSTLAYIGVTASLSTRGDINYYSPNDANYMGDSYRLSEQALSRLYSFTKTNTERSDINQHMMKNFQGAAYGLCLAMAECKAGRVNVKDYASRFTEFRNLSYPRNHPPVRDMVMFYELSQYLDCVKNQRMYIRLDKNNRKENHKSLTQLLKLASSANNTRRGILMVYYSRKDENSPIEGHPVLVTGSYSHGFYFDGVPAGVSKDKQTAACVLFYDPADYRAMNNFHRLWIRKPYYKKKGVGVYGNNGDVFITNDSRETILHEKVEYLYYINLDEAYKDIRPCVRPVNTHVLLSNSVTALDENALPANDADGLPQDDQQIEDIRDIENVTPTNIPGLEDDTDVLAYYNDIQKFDLDTAGPADGYLFADDDAVLSVDIDEKADITAWFGNAGGYRIKLDGKGAFTGATAGEAKDIKGPLSVKEYGYTGYMGDDVQMQFKFDTQVDGLDPFGYQIDQPEGEPRDVYYTYEKGDKFSCIDATNVKYVEFKNDFINSVHAPEGEQTSYTVFLTSGDDIWDTLMIEGCSNKFYIDYWTDGIIIDSDNMKDLTITSFYYDDTATLEINTSAERICVKKCPENGPAGINAYISSDGQNEDYDVLIASSKKTASTPESKKESEIETKQESVSHTSDYNERLLEIKAQTPNLSQSAAQLKKAMPDVAGIIYHRAEELVVHAKEGESKLSIDESFDWTYLKAAGAEYLVFEQKGASVLVPTDRTGALELSLTEADGGHKLEISNGETAALRLELKGKSKAAKLQRLEGSVWVDCDVECVLMNVGGRRVMQTAPVPSGTYRAFYD